jgi:hypothetical protein
VRRGWSWVSKRPRERTLRNTPSAAMRRTRGGDGGGTGLRKVNNTSDEGMRGSSSFSRFQGTSSRAPNSPLGRSQAPWRLPLSDVVFGGCREDLLLAVAVRCSSLPSRVVSIAPLLQLCVRLQVTGFTQRLVSASCTAHSLPHWDHTPWLAAQR